MNLVVAKCPSCGASIELDENQEFGFYKYCGTKTINEEARVQKIEVTNPVKIEGKID